MFRELLEERSKWRRRLWPVIAAIMGVITALSLLLLQAKLSEQYSVSSFKSSVQLKGDASSEEFRVSPERAQALKDKGFQRVAVAGAGVTERWLHSDHRFIELEGEYFIRVGGRMGLADFTCKSTASHALPFGKVELVLEVIELLLAEARRVSFVPTGKTLQAKVLVRHPTAVVNFNCAQPF